MIPHEQHPLPHSPLIMRQLFFKNYVTCRIHNTLQNKNKKPTYTHKKLSFFTLNLFSKSFILFAWSIYEGKSFRIIRLNVKFNTTQGKWLLTFNINMSSCAAIKSQCVTIQLRCSRHQANFSPLIVWAVSNRSDYTLSSDKLSVEKR